MNEKQMTPDIVDNPVLAAISPASVGARLKRIRNLIKKTIEEMAEGTGIARSYISEIENGKRKATSKYIEQLIAYFDVNPNYIYLGTGTPFRSQSKGDDLLNHGELTSMVFELLEAMKLDKRVLFFILHKWTEYKKHLEENRTDDI